MDTNITVFITLIVFAGIALIESRTLSLFAFILFIFSGSFAWAGRRAFSKENVMMSVFPSGILLILIGLTEYGVKYVRPWTFSEATAFFLTISGLLLSGFGLLLRAFINRQI